MSSATVHHNETREKLAAAVGELEAALNRTILGQRELVRLFLAGVLAGGHLLLEGLPGLGKTQMVRAFGKLSGMAVSRIQFTPDLMPLDITGSSLLRKTDGAQAFEFNPGPVFANVLVADEINRASPKTQAALLEAMQEGQVTVLGETHLLPRPFSVLATQNPVELEGTYPLPEAQLDRFLFKLDVKPVGVEVLRELAAGRAGGALPELEPATTPAQFAGAMELVKSVAVSDPVADYIARLVDATRPGMEGPAGAVKFGASPRAVIGMAAAARAMAFMGGRGTVGFDDVKAVAQHVLRHRIILEYRAVLDGVTADEVSREIIAAAPELDRAEPNSLAAKLAKG